MMRVRSWVWAVTLSAGVAGRGASGQAPVVSGGSDETKVLPATAVATGASVLPAASVADVLVGLASRAGVVFVGQVQSIVAKDGVVEITFQVQQPVRGVAAGKYVEREWAGRWVGGQQRYRVGQSAMFFLRAPNAAGLSSPVDGMAGVVPLVPMGADGVTLLDARMLGTRVVRAIGKPIVDAEFGAVALDDAKKVVMSGQAAERPEQEQAEPLRRRLPASMMMTIPTNSTPGKISLTEEILKSALLQSGEGYDAQP
jgi:hypothetical protein